MLLQDMLFQAVLEGNSRVQGVRACAVHSTVVFGGRSIKAICESVHTIMYMQ